MKDVRIKKMLEGEISIWYDINLLKLLKELILITILWWLKKHWN